MGANTLLKKVRLHPAGDKLNIASQQQIMADVRADGHKVGNHQLLLYMDVHKAALHGKFREDPAGRRAGPRKDRP